jgi:hypothetical protein
VAGLVVFSQQADCEFFGSCRGLSFIWGEINPGSDSANVREMLFQLVLGCTFHFDSSLNCAANLGEDGACVRANQTYSAHQNDEYHREHDRVFRYTLAFFRSQHSQIEIAQVFSSTAA